MLLLSITTHEHQKYVMQAVEESGQTVLNAMVSQQVRFSDLVKQQEKQWELAQSVILDVDGVEDSEEDLIQAMQQFRMLYSARLIFVAAGREAGSRLLHEIFCAGIYDIVTSEKDQMQRDLLHCLQQGMTFKDALPYKVEVKEEKEEEKRGKRPFLEKKEITVIKRREPEIACQEMIGLAGSQSRVGVTHSCILIARYLAELGFQVAVIEKGGQPTQALAAISDAYGIEIKSKIMSFTMQSIDFYPAYDLKQGFTFSKEYSFVLLDLGAYEESVEEILAQCSLSILIGGTKSWEREAMNQIFRRLPETLLSTSYYLFPMTPQEAQKDLMESLEPLHQILFFPYRPEPFQDSVPAEVLQPLFQRYLPEEKREEKIKWSFLPFGKK